MFSFSFMNTSNFHIYFYYFSTAVFLMRLSEKKLSFILVLYIHTQIFTMVSFFFSFFFGTFHKLYNFSTPIRISSLALCRTALALSLSLPLCVLFCFPGISLHSFPARRSTALAPFCPSPSATTTPVSSLSRSPSLLLSVSLLPPKIVSALSIFPV